MFSDRNVKSSFAERHELTPGTKLWRSVWFGLNLIEQNGFNLESISCEI